MATIFGEPGEEPGDQRVFKALHHLPDEAIVYAQPQLIHKREESNPDYVIIHPQWGVIVLEVKDWTTFKTRSKKEATIYRKRTGEYVNVENPLKQARNASFVLENMLKENTELIHYAGIHEGKLQFPRNHAVALPNIPASTVTWLEQKWGEGHLLSRDDLKPERLTKKIESIPSRFHVPMSERHVRVVCAVIDPDNILRDKETKNIKGILDFPQETLVKESLDPKVTIDKKADKDSAQASFIEALETSPEQREAYLESTVPDEVLELREASYVRLVRGFAGTGKTDVLVLRARYLAEHYPEKSILVTTFNRPILEERLQPELKDLRKSIDVFTFDEICAALYKKRNHQWNKPQSPEGVVANIAQDDPKVQKFGVAFIMDEIIWLKESGLTNREAYLKATRLGRGRQSGRRLSQNMKNEIFDIYEEYQRRLGDLPAFDWVDLHENVWRWLQEGLQPDKKYDVILIDEAQHFAPTWMRIIQAILNPNGAMFISDDPSQSVYRLFSWRQRGVDVVGRTRWLRIPYRNTRQIFRAAFSLIASNPLALAMLKEDGSNIQPDLNAEALRDGDRPVMHHFPHRDAEIKFIQNKITELVETGVLPNEICILHTRSHILDKYKKEILPLGNVHIEELKRVTGMEYKVVFIPQIQELFERDTSLGWDKDIANRQITFYMGMTRARDKLYLSYQKNLPKFLEPVLTEIIFKNHA